MLLPPSNRVRIVRNKKNGDYEVQKGIFIVTHGPLWKCENYCQMNGYIVTNQTEVNAAKRVILPIDAGVTG